MTALLSISLHLAQFLELAQVLKIGWGKHLSNQLMLMFFYAESLTKAKDNELNDKIYFFMPRMTHTVEAFSDLTPILAGHHLMCLPKPNHC